MSVTAVPLQPIKRSHVVWLWVGLLIGVAGAVALAWYGTRPMVAARMSDADFLAWHKQQPGIRTTASGLQYEVLHEGKGAKPSEGSVTLVRIAGRLRDGTIFQPDTQAATPFMVGQGIKGFDEGLKLMPEGSRYRFWIPGDIGYGPSPDFRSGIPADALLIFDVDLRSVVSEAQLREFQMRQMMQQQQMQQQMQQGAEGGEAVPGDSEGAAPPR